MNSSSMDVAAPTMTCCVARLVCLSWGSPRACATRWRGVSRHTWAADLDKTNEQMICMLMSVLCVPCLSTASKGADQGLRHTQLHTPVVQRDQTLRLHKLVFLCGAGS